MEKTRHRKTPRYQSSAVLKITKTNFACKTAIAATSSIASICYRIVTNKKRLRYVLPNAQQTPKRLSM
jgi:hypothetical protein